MTWQLEESHFAGTQNDLLWFILAYFFPPTHSQYFDKFKGNYSISVTEALYESGEQVLPAENITFQNELCNDKRVTESVKLTLVWMRRPGDKQLNGGFYAFS